MANIFDVSPDDQLAMILPLPVGPVGVDSVLLPPGSQIFLNQP